ncbi:MAG: PSP1 domain-containing protein, partial [Ruminococcus sp.]|nr:PSP1 domain-containing protein [Ruminococcus sp.]
MAKIIGVKFKDVGKVYYFSPNGLELNVGDKVIVETARGVECGEVALGLKEISDEELNSPLKGVMRKATAKDLDIVEQNKKKEKDAFKICEEKIAKHGLKMDLVDVEWTFDGNKILFYFTADN